MTCRIGYALTTHRDPDQIRRLVDRLTAHPSTSGVAIHHDRSSGPLTVGFARPDLVSIIPDPLAVAWGSWSRVQQLMGAMNHLCERFPETEWIVSLSGQDYPVKPLDELDGFFGATTYDAFVQSDPAMVRFTSEGARWRYEYRHYALPLFVPRRVGRVLGRILGRFPYWCRVTWWLPEPQAQYVSIRNRHVVADNLVGGSDWIMVNRTSLEQLNLGFVDPRWTGQFRRARHASEVFYATTLARTSLAVRSADYRIAQFGTGYAPHPRVLTLDDLDLLMSTDAFFARKMQIPDSVALLDELDRRCSLG